MSKEKFATALLTHEDHFPQKWKKAYEFLVYLLTGLFIGCYIIRYIIPLC